MSTRSRRRWRANGRSPSPCAVTSETGGYGEAATNRRLFAQLERYRPEFLLLVRDAVGDGTAYAAWQRVLFGPGRARFAHTPFCLCLGNHEAQAPWYERFTAYPPPHAFYAFDCGALHVVALDSTALVAYAVGPAREG
jgi:Calcineurin-like phosphoesterase